MHAERLIERPQNVMARLTRSDTRHFGELIDTLYQSVQNPIAWKKAMAQFCQYITSDSGSIRVYTADWSRVFFSATHAFDSAFDAAYLQYFNQIDPISTAVRQSDHSLGSTFPLYNIQPAKELKKTEFYNDYMRPQDKHYILAGHISQASGTQILVGAQRSRSRQPFGATECERFKLLGPHLQQTLCLTELFAEKGVLISAFDRVLDTLSVGAFFLDRSGRIRYINPSAEAMMQAENLVANRQGRLVAIHEQRNALLQALIRRVLTNGPAKELPAIGGGVQLAPAKGDRGETTAIVVPWNQPSTFHAPIGPRIAIAVFIGSRMQPDLERGYLVGAYGLTPTEARLTARLVDRGRLEQAAEDIGVTQQTARDYLKSVFAKTDCRSQGNLISMILNSPSGLWGRHNHTGNP